MRRNMPGCCTVTVSHARMHRSAIEGHVSEQHDFYREVKAFYEGQGTASAH